MGKYLVHEIKVSRRSSAPSWISRECEITTFGECFDYGEADTLEGARVIMLNEFKKEWQIDQYTHIWEISEITSRDEEGNPKEWEALETWDLWRKSEVLR